LASSVKFILNLGKTAITVQGASPGAHPDGLALSLQALRLRRNHHPPFVCRPWRQASPQRDIVNFRQTKVATQLMLGFSVLILLMAVLGAAAWYGLNTVEAQLSEVQTNLMPSVATAKTMQAEIRAFNLAQYRALTANDAQRMQDARTRLTASLGRYTSAADQYRPLIHTSEEQAAYDELQALLPKYLAVSQQMLAALEQGRQEQAVDIMKDQLSRCARRWKCRSSVSSLSTKRASPKPPTTRATPMPAAAC
jgi:CHASE3 domain sensor protein